MNLPVAPKTNCVERKAPYTVSFSEGGVGLDPSVDAYFR
jgi:hypothetical protein